MKLLFVISVVLIVSCNDRNVNVERNYIRKISVISRGAPFEYQSLELFVKVDSGLKANTNLGELFDLFNRFYSDKYSNYHVFLFDALNEKIALSKNQFRWGAKYFKLDDSITKIYTYSRGSFFKSFIEKMPGHGLMIVRDHLTFNQFYTVLYYYFINKYEIVFGDMPRAYYVHKR